MSEKRVQQQDLNGTPVREWIDAVIDGITISEKRDVMNVYVLTSGGFSLRISEPAFQRAAAERGAWERVVAARVRMTKDADLADEDGVRKRFAKILKDGAKEIQAKDVKGEWVSKEVFIWHTELFELKSGIDAALNKIARWRMRKTKMPKRADARKKALAKLDGQIRAWVQHKMKLRRGATCDAGDFDKNYGVLDKFFRGKIEETDRGQTRLESAANPGAGGE